jgi:hypothetical protein
LRADENEWLWSGWRPADEQRELCMGGPPIDQGAIAATRSPKLSWCLVMLHRLVYFAAQTPPSFDPVASSSYHVVGPTGAVHPGRHAVDTACAPAARLYVAHRCAANAGVDAGIDAGVDAGIAM